MNNYRRFKYPFGGETPEEFAAARQQYYANNSANAYQQIAPSSTPSNLKHVEPTIPEVKEYMERTGREVTDYINRNYKNQPDTRKGKLIRNHDSKYDYYKVGDRLYTRRKGTDTWTDISDNEVAVNRINSYLRNNRSNKSNTSISSSGNKSKSSNVTSTSNTRISEAKTYDGGTLNEVTVTSKNKSNNSKINKNKINDNDDNEPYITRSQAMARWHKKRLDANKKPNNVVNYNVVNPVDAINKAIRKNLYGVQEVNASVIARAGAKPYTAYLNTPPAPTGYPKNAVIKQAPPRYRGR